jgi:hypothetical protein
MQAAHQVMSCEKGWEAESVVADGGDKWENMLKQALLGRGF